LFLHFCSPCHGETGQGDGLVVQHGYPPPPSYSKGQSSRGGAMKDLTDGKIYHTITYGVNAMGSYASQVAPEDRWKVVMYVHHLQNL
jgi:mono/diheme cytochrome c family protein